MEDFILAPHVRQNYFVLHGLAGTGKTYLLAQLTYGYPELILTAFTGKAASVLRKRVGCNVSTLHSAIYNFVGLEDDKEEPERKNPMFTPKGLHIPEKVVLVDECSMIGQRPA